MQAIIRRSIPAAITATVVAGAAITIPAVAATDSDGSDTTQESVEERPGQRGVGHRLGHRLAHGLEEGEFQERLAVELGLDVETLQEALDAVKADLLDERLTAAVDDGRLTQEQADALAAAIAAGDREAAGEVLRDARLAGLEERLAERVEAGDLTQEEADEILERAEDGDFPGRRGPRGHGPRAAEGPPGGGDLAPPVAGEDASV